MNLENALQNAFLANAMRDASARSAVSPFGACYGQMIASRAGLLPESRETNYAEAADEIFQGVYGAPARAGAIYVPFTMGRRLDQYKPFSIGQRDLDTSSADAIIASRHDGSLIDAIRPYSGVIASGAQLITGLVQTRPFVLPRIDTGPGVFWIADGGSPSPADPSFDQCLITPYTLAAKINISRLAGKNNSVAQSLEVALSGEIQRAMWAEVDRVALNGTGTGHPLGILQDPAVNVVSAGTDGAAPSLGLMTDIEFEQSTAFSGGPLTWFTNSAARRKIRRTATGSGLAPIWSETNRILGHAAAVTEHVPGDYVKGDGTDLSAVVLGDFSQLTIAMWGAPAFQVLLNPYGSAPNGTAELTVFLDVGVGIRHSEGFVTCKDLITSVS